jgi:hypothetical protein
VNIVLVAQHHSRSPQAVPLAGAFLAAALTADEVLAASCHVILCDLFPDISPEAAVDTILAAGPDAVGISVYVWNRRRAVALARALKLRQPGLVLFAGGPEPGEEPRPFLGPELFDFVVVGEGEITFVEAMAALREGRSVATIPGVATLGTDGVSLVRRHPTALPDTLPSPLLTGILDSARYNGMLWQLTRGCDFGCTYCCDTAGVKGTRRFSLDRVEAELRLLARSRISQVFVLDSTFNRDPERAKRILRLVRKHAPHIHFHFEVRSEFIDREQAQLFAAITCSLQIGLQSAQPKVLNGVGRHLDRDDFAQRVGFLNEAGVIFGFDLIYGLPGDTLDGFRKSLDFALALYPNHLDIFPLAILPGAPLAKSAARLGLRQLPDPPYTLLESPTFPAADLAGAARLAGACDLFYCRGKAVAWFNGVCRAVSLAPTELLAEFARWLSREAPGRGEEELTDDEVWQFQRHFLSALFLSRNRKKLLPLALDLADYHHHYAAALLTPPPELPTERELARMDLANTLFRAASSTRLARFHYEINVILEAGEVDLKEFSRCFRKADSWAAIYPRADEVMTESLAEPFFRLLERLDGRALPRDLWKELGMDQEEALSFLEFAVAEGIVVTGGIE